MEEQIQQGGIPQPPPRKQPSAFVKSVGPVGVALAFLAAKGKALLGVLKLAVPALKFLKLAKCLAHRAERLYSRVPNDAAIAQRNPKRVVLLVLGSKAKQHRSHPLSHRR